MSDPGGCPICLDSYSEPATLGPGIDGWGYRIDCAICGRFDLDAEVWEDFLDPTTSVGQALSPVSRARLAHKLRMGTVEPGPANLPRVTSEFVSHFVADGCPGPTPFEQANKAVFFVGQHVTRSGEPLDRLPQDFFAIVGAPNLESAAKLVKELIDRGTLKGIDASTFDGPEVLDIDLTLDGWDLFQEIRHGEVSEKIGFIAMQFGDGELDPFVDNVLKPAVQQRLGYRVVDMRNVARAGIIDNIMRAQIRDAAFVVVDLTHDNPGAYWEAGYAEGLGKPVIYICERSKFEDAQTHFDTNHCTTVLWTTDNSDEFAEELVATLRRSLNLFPTDEG